jgi:hypothetical protein
MTPSSVTWFITAILPITSLLSSVPGCPLRAASSHRTRRPPGLPSTRSAQAEIDISVARGPDFLRARYSELGSYLK